MLPNPFLVLATVPIVKIGFGSITGEPVMLHRRPIACLKAIDLLKLLVNLVFIFEDF